MIDQKAMGNMNMHRKRGALPSAPPPILPRSNNRDIKYILDVDTDYD